MELSEIDQRLAAFHRGRKWIIAAEVAAGAADFTRTLEEWGAETLIVAAAPGVGEPPSTTLVMTDAQPQDTMMGGIREALRSMLEPSDEVLGALHQFDPSGEASVIVPDFHAVGSLFGRATYGPRPRTAEALENKTIVDELWDAAGVARAPSEVVPVDRGPDAATRIANEHGSVWVADNKLGWHGGAGYTRWVGPEDDPSETVAWFADQADQIRVMPFLEGIPCSIHGYVTGSGTAAFRPVEMVTLRRTDRRALMYGGVATYWDPSPSDREEMREVARRVAAELRRRIGYLGPFSVDGVMTTDGFRPTELNPRMSAGLGQLASTVEGLRLMAMTRALREGDMEVDTDWLEALIVESADARRAGGAYTVVQGQSFPEDRLDDDPIDVVFVDGVVRRVNDGEAAHGAVAGGMNPAGAYIRLTLDPEVFPSGDSIGPVGVALMAFIESEYGLEVGPVAAAPDVRRASVA